MRPYLILPCSDRYWTLVRRGLDVSTSRAALFVANDHALYGLGEQLPSFLFLQKVRLIFRFPLNFSRERNTCYQILSFGATTGPSLHAYCILRECRTEKANLILSFIAQLNVVSDLLNIVLTQKSRFF